MSAPVTVKAWAHRGASLPMQATPGAAGLDLASADTLVIMPGDRRLAGTGVHVEIPPGFEGQIRPRSGLANARGLTVLNTPGTIDSDYRGEVRVLLVNLGPSHIEIRRGDRIAQLVIAPTPAVELVPVECLEDLAETNRGAGGFGSTGR
jgi:dUTP pyrophosphatase